MALDASASISALCQLSRSSFELKRSGRSAAQDKGQLRLLSFKLSCNVKKWIFHSILETF